MATHDDPTRIFSLQAQNEIDEFCDEFESAWQRGEHPNISNFLRRTSSDIWPNLFVELVRLDIEYRSTLGDAPTVKEYAQRFPQFEQLLLEIRTPASPSSIQRLADIREIGGFKLLQKAGAGTFGVVWKAWDSQLEREVAVKLPTESSLSREYAAEFRREATAAAKLNHPGIVRVIDYGMENGVAYIVYDFIHGVTLQKWLKRNDVTHQKAAQHCVQIAEALSHAHTHGVVHRDLKPGNILIDMNGRPHITDFGLAKRDDSGSTAAGSGVIVGTFKYMSPEQAEGKSSEIDGRADIYSLGVILYESLAGKPVFQGDAREMLQKILFADPPALSTLVKGLSPDLEVICHKCLQKNKNDRYQTAEELAADLKRFVNGEPVLARPVSQRIYVARSLKKHWQTVVPTFAVAGLLALIITQQNHSPESEEPSTEPAAITESNKVPRVRVITERAGASVAVVQCDSKTGEPMHFSFDSAAERTPCDLELSPGRYSVYVSLPEEGGLRTHMVHRTMPGKNGEWPSMTAGWERFHALSSTEIHWPTIKIPPNDVAAEMTYVEGTNEFVVEGPNGSKTVSVAPFYVASREFTFGDFVKLRPGEPGDVPGKPAAAQPAINTMPARYDMAEHWAEESGCRLLTDLEFAYLAKLAADAQEQRKVSVDSESAFDVAGGSDLDEIPTTPPIRGILTGYAEWTSTWPTSPLITTFHSTDTSSLGSPELQRIIRGGVIDCTSTDSPRNANSTCAATIYNLFPHVGFRLARSSQQNAVQKNEAEQEPK